MTSATDEFAELATWLPELTKPDFDFGHWVPAERPAPAVVTMPYFAFSPEGLALLAAVPVQEAFDWSRWKDTDEGRSLLNDQSMIAAATPDQLLRLTTTLMRSDRFTDGVLATAFESGQLTAIVRRAAALRRAKDHIF